MSFMTKLWPNKGYTEDVQTNAIWLYITACSMLLTPYKSERHSMEDEYATKRADMGEIDHLSANIVQGHDEDRGWFLGQD